MRSWLTKALIVGVVLGGLGHLTLANRMAAPPEALPGRLPEKPPTEAEFRALFAADPEGFEAVKDLVLSLPQPSMSIQSDFLSWPGVQGHGWTARGDDRWWAGDDRGGPGLWKDSEAVYREAGMSAEDHERVAAFLARHGLFHLGLQGGHGDRDRTVTFSSRTGLSYAWEEREIVWHTDPMPFAQDSTFVYSETKKVPQETRERSLPAPGWFVRTTTRFDVSSRDEIR